MSENNGSNKLVVVLLIVTLLVLVAVAGFFGYNMFIKPNNQEAKNTVSEKSVDEKTIPLEEIVTNLADEGKSRYIKIKLTLGYTNNDLEKEIPAKMYIIKHDILVTLMGKKAENFKTQELNKVISELKDKINTVLNGGKVTNIYINDFIIQ